MGGKVMSDQKTLSELLALVSNSACPSFPDEGEITVHSKTCEGDTPLHFTARWGDAEGTKLLIAAGADVNAIGDMSETLLHVSLREGNEDLVRLLMSAGARTDMRSEFNETPLERAQRMGQEYVEWLRVALDGR